MPVKAPPQVFRIKSPPAAHAQQAVKATVAPQGLDRQLIAPAVQPPPKVKAIPKPLPVKAPPHKMPPAPKPLQMKAPPPPSAPMTPSPASPKDYLNAPGPAEHRTPWYQSNNKRVRGPPGWTGRFSDLGSSSDSVPLGSPPGLAVPSSDSGGHWISWNDGAWSSWNVTHDGSRDSRWQ